MPAVVDVRFYNQVEQVAKKAAEQFGHIDILVNCAGGSAARIKQVDGFFPRMDPEVIDWGLDVNLKGPLHFARAVLPYMLEQKSGVMINVGSTCGNAGQRLGGIQRCQERRDVRPDEIGWPCMAQGMEYAAAA